MLRDAARFLLFSGLLVGSVFAYRSHGRKLVGRANCKPVIVTAICEAALIAIAIWG